MASNSIIQCNPSSSHTTRKHDVFVSFCGDDTRNNFTGFLFHALHKKRLDAFKDDTHLKKGESIAPALLQAIEGSRIFVVVFSKNYASSTWCLRELAHICNCMRTSSRPVLPIFYDVDPSDVRKQSGFYAKVFSEHEERFREDKEKMEEVQRWREALTQVANLSGWHIGNKQQHSEIDEIVQKMVNILGHKYSCLPNDNLVGMECSVAELTKLLLLGLVNDVRVVGISGMSGIGKTTLVRALYERISHQYDFCCFIDDVSKIYQDSHTIGIQKQLLSQCLNEKNLEIYNVSEGKHLIWTSLHARALIVFDNVNQVGQLKMFIGSKDSLLSNCLGKGSRIIVISRDEQILRMHGVDDVYQVQPLNGEEALQLFCRNAFKCDYIISGYNEFTHDILSHTEGHPLAIEVIGSSLLGRSFSQWRSALARIRDNKSRNIMDVLRISFDELDDIDKEIFLDIACFFGFYREDYVNEILDFRGFHPEYGLQVLIDKSLITIDQEGLIDMHGLLRDLGRCIVREKSPKDPRKWSRLWHHKDLYKVLSNNMEAVYLEAIVINSHFPHTTMKVDTLSKMSHLKLLKLQCVKFSGSLNDLSTELGYITWFEYPFDSLPQSFQPDNLVELIMRHSNIKQLWTTTKHLPSLRRLDLSHSKNLIETGNLGEAPNLESLDLEGCIQLKHIDSSIGLLRKLTIVNLKDCKSLIKLPHFAEDLSLEILNLEGCIQLKHIDSSIGHLIKLSVLSLKDCINLVSFPHNLLGHISLKCLTLSGCSRLYNNQLLDESTDAELLKKLEIVKVPIHSQSSSSYFKAHDVSISCLFPSSSIFRSMHQLDLSFCNLLQIPDAIGNLRCLQRLNLKGNNFATLPSLKELSKLLHLNLYHCKQLKHLAELPSRTDFWSNYYMPEWPSSYDELKTIPLSSSDEVGVGLHIFNCPKLVDRERCTEMSFLWMLQIIKAYVLFEPVEDRKWSQRTESIFPGSEIPRMFKNQQVKSLISIDSSPIRHHKNFIGVLCCAVFAVGQERGTVSEMDSQKPNFSVYVPEILGDDPVKDETDHLWLWYFDRPLFFSPCPCGGIPFLGDIKVKFDIRDRRGFHSKVKKFAYLAVYKHDLHLSKLPNMHGRKVWPRNCWKCQVD